jgi:hypothetical protein
VFARARQRVNAAREAANRWTDNVWAVKKHCVRQLNQDSKRMDQAMGLAPDFDYVD